MVYSLEKKSQFNVNKATLTCSKGTTGTCLDHNTNTSVFLYLKITLHICCIN